MRLVNMQKRSQAAMEFMASYGWAILAVLMALSALSYMGFKMHEGPEICVLEFGIACTDYSVQKNTINLLLTNSLGTDITILSISANNCTHNFTQMIAPQKAHMFTLNCPTGNSKGRYKTNLVVSYRDKEFVKYKNGKIVAKIE